MDVKGGDFTDVQEEKDPLLIHEVSFEAVILCVCKMEIVHHVSKNSVSIYVDKINEMQLLRG